MHIPENSHSTYWMHGTLEKRVDKYEDAKESGFTKNRFRVKNLTIINRWGEKGTIPETLTVNLTRNTAWALGTEVELHTTEEDEAIMFEQSKICDTTDEEDEVAEVCSLDILMNRSSRVYDLMPPNLKGPEYELGHDSEFDVKQGVHVKHQPDPALRATDYNSTLMTRNENTDPESHSQVSSKDSRTICFTPRGANQMTSIRLEEHRLMTCGRGALGKKHIQVRA